MKARVLYLVALCLSILVCKSELTEANLQRLTFDQKIGSAVPLGLTFRDDKNRMTTLGDCLQNRPAILILGYYECPMLCNLVLNGVVESLQEVKPSADSGEAIIFVSIDPREGPALAANKKATYLKRFARPDAAEHWHFLCGEEKNVKALAEAVGFHYQFDQEHNQFAHPSGIVLLTPDGRVSRYFFGVSYPAAELRQALADASLKRTGSAIQTLAILCSRWLPLTGKFSGTVMTAVRMLAIGTVVSLAGIVVFNQRAAKAARERRSAR